VWIGAGVTALLFVVGKFLIGLYLGKSSVASSFGAFGSVVLLMLWVYYSAQIFLFGAEFTWVYANEFGSRSHDPKTEQPAPAREPGTKTPGTAEVPRDEVVRNLDWDTVRARSRAAALVFAAHQATEARGSRAFAPVRRHKHALALIAGAAAAVGYSFFRGRKTVIRPR
jgi:hypothetical protein